MSDVFHPEHETPEQHKAINALMRSLVLTVLAQVLAATGGFWLALSIATSTPVKVTWILLVVVAICTLWVMILVGRHAERLSDELHELATTEA